MFNYQLLIELHDGLRVETVIMRYGEVELDSFPKKQTQELAEEGHEDDASEDLKFKSQKRATVCVSSQVGCAMGCTL